MAAYLTARPAPGTMLRGFGAPPATPTSPPSHLGQDYGWGEGTQVFAARAGKVKAYAAAGAYGNRLIIDHGDGRETWYCHLDGIQVKLGAEVAAGQHIATMGDTGNTTAVHLHFELRIGGVAVDPAPYFTDTAGGGSSLITERKPMFSLIKDAGSAVIWIASTITGIRVGFKSVTDYNLLKKFRDGINGDPLNATGNEPKLSAAQMDIVRGYLQLINPPAGFDLAAVVTALDAANDDETEAILAAIGQIQPGGDPAAIAAATADILAQRLVS